MGLEIQLPTEMHERLVMHLTASRPEEVAFLAAQLSGGLDSLEVFDLLTLQCDDFAVQTALHVRLADGARARVIRWAHESHSALVEAHSHRSTYPAEFSPSDLWGLGEWVPHVRWRLPDRPYAALVFSDVSFDALAWAGSGSGLNAVAGLRVAGKLLRPTGLSYAALTAPSQAAQ